MHTRTSLHRHRYMHVCTCNHSRWHTDLLLQGQGGRQGAGSVRLHSQPPAAAEVRPEPAR